VGIPLSDVKAQYAPLLDELRRRLDDVLASGRFVLGPNVRAFEDEAAAYLGVPHAVGVANGTDALVLALDALGIGPGDEVVCPAFTFFATAEAIARRGATPVFADIDAATLNLDPADVAERLSPRTKAILAVHLFGRPAPVEELAALAPVVEDAAQAFGAEAGGARVGALGRAATFSFYPTKNLFGLGDGGLVTATDGDVADRVRVLRFHGSRDKQTFETIGYNSRLDELQAAALRVLLPELDGWNDARRGVADAYERQGLGEHVSLPSPVDGARHVYHLYVVRHERSDELQAALAGRGVQSRAYYRVPIHMQPAVAAEADLPGTAEAARTHLALPMGPLLTEDHVRAVVEACASGST
jgi:dTDP-4-amino-4,6-dideoxygalactose transaminase